MKNNTNCIICGNSNNTGHKYCSLICYNKSRERKHKICLYCQKEFICLDKNTQKFCSQKCMGFYHRKKEEIKTRKINEKRQYLNKVCKCCGKEFSYYDKMPERVYCSKSCAAKSTKIEPFPYSVETTCECGCNGKIKNPTDEGYYKRYLPGHKFFGKKNGPTCIEKELYTYLDKVGIEYEKQKRIGITIPDAYIPKLNLCVYADGQYWHTRERTILSDKRCEDYLTNNNYLWIRLKDINRKTLNLIPLTQYLLQNIKYIF